MGRHIMAQTNRFLMFYYTRHYQESSLSQKVTLLILLRLHRVGKSVTYLICSSRLEWDLFSDFKTLCIEDTSENGMILWDFQRLASSIVVCSIQISILLLLCFPSSPPFFPDKHVNKSCQEKASFLLFKPPSSPPRLLQTVRLYFPHILDQSESNNWSLWK